MNNDHVNPIMAQIMEPYTPPERSDKDWLAELTELTEAEATAIEEAAAEDARRRFDSDMQEQLEFNLRRKAIDCISDIILPWRKLKATLPNVDPADLWELVEAASPGPVTVSTDEQRRQLIPVLGEAK